MIEVAVFNHNCNNNAIKLTKEFRKLANTYLVDSGSHFENEEEQNQFDTILPNVFYCGMLNDIVRHYSSSSNAVLFVASDVLVQHPELMIERAKKAFLNPKVGVYAPSVNKEGSNHPQMRNKNSNKLRNTLFVDGFCFAARSELLKKIFPIDLKLNKIGWGVDVYLAYEAIRSKMICVVDDLVQVEHYVGPNDHPNPGIFINEAKKQRHQWFQSLSQGARNFNKLASIELFKNQLGAKALQCFPW